MTKEPFKNGERFTTAILESGEEVYIIINKYETVNSGEIITRYSLTYNTLSDEEGSVGCYRYTEKIKSIVIPDYVYSIYLIGNNITHLEIPKSVKIVVIDKNIPNLEYLIENDEIETRLI